MDKNTKFGAAYEDHLRRYTKSGFSVGNYVKFKGSKINPDLVSDFPDHYVERLNQIKDSDLPIKISSIARGTSLGDGDFEGLPTDFNIIIGQEFAMGMMQNYIAVPANALELADFTIPDSWKGEGFDEQITEPTEVDFEKGKGQIEFE
jgi:hypothetical protein